MMEYRKVLFGIALFAIFMGSFGAAATNNFLDDIYSIINGVRLESGKVTATNISTTNITATTGTFTNIYGGTWEDSQNINQKNITNISYAYFGSSNSGYIYDNGTALIIGRS